jgi:flagellar motor component MotA
VDLRDIKVYLSHQTPTEKFEVKRVYPYYVYVDGKATGKIQGYTYLVKDPFLCEQLRVKVDGEEPEEIQKGLAKRETVFVSFENARIRLSEIDGTIRQTIVASSVTRVG